MTRIALAVALALGAIVLHDTRATADDDKTGVVIDVDNPGRSLYPLAIPTGIGDKAVARQVAEVATFDMKVAGWFKVLDPRGFLADLKKEGLGIQPDKWKGVGAFGVIKFKVRTRGNRVKIEFNLFEVEKGNRPVLSRSYTGSKGDVRSFTHAWCNEVVEYYTKEPGFFGSKIAFVSKRKRKSKVYAMDFDGHGVHTLTRNSSINILPAWSPDGGRVAFTSYMRNNPDLYIVGAGGGRPKRISRHRGMNTGAAWSPDGSKLAVTLSKDGNPDIYVISAKSGKILRRLTKNRAIDIAPAWSPDGSQIAFVSDREGGPQIFVMSAGGGGAKRVSFNGTYNTTPVWNPRKDVREIAYTTRDQGNFDVVTLDLATGDMVRITQNQGDNEAPSYSPNGRVIAFASSRSGGAGVYLANADGTGEQHRVWSGYATSIDWGPTP